MNISNMILNNPRAAFWVISAFWFLVSALIWGPLFSYLGYKVRTNREPDETKILRKENRDLMLKNKELEEERDVLKHKRKSALIALA